jgi:hypothetical protein
MHRWLILVLSVALAVPVFAPVAAAHGDDGGFDDKGMHARGADDMGFDDRGMVDRRVEDRGFDDNVGASPTSSASASASPSASASARTTASPTATATPVLPDTGGLTSVSTLGPLAMLVGGGLLALGILRRR